VSGTTSPVATYRLQLTPAFGFDRAASVTGYLADLGVSHLYLSPILEARRGSTHGYDQTDPTRVRAELGGEAAFERLVKAARARGLGIVIDIVPNHMAAHHANPWWYGLLRHGRGSHFDRYFDVDWECTGGRMVLPVLGAPLTHVIQRGELVVERFESGELGLRYFDRMFPLREELSAAAVPQEPEALRGLLERQHYELAFWREGLERINYRRFFDIADLAGLRVEDSAVFEHAHAKILELTARGWVQGVRVDHIDGLRDPHQYLRRLRTRLNSAARGGVWPLIFVEKILARDERMPVDWPIDGATGYEFLSAATHAMIDPLGARECREHAATGGAGVRDFHALAIACKELVAGSLLGPELSRLCRSATASMRTAGLACDAQDLQLALVRVSARLGVYRTYADDDGMSESDVERVRGAVAAAAGHRVPPSLGAAIEVLEDVLTLAGAFATGSARSAALDTVRLWQQFTGPLAAKGVEDTALYRDVACPALNEVGTEPVPAEREGDASAALVELAEQRRARPFSMNAGDTHDAKRSEDVRARLAALTHAPEPWLGALDEAASALSRMASDKCAVVPTPADLSLIVHSAAALWPGENEDFMAGDEARLAVLAERITAYIVKAAREAKVSSSWASPDPGYEGACARAVHSLMFDAALDRARSRICGVARATRPLSGRLAIAAVLLRTLFPGTPDWYQGTECAALSLVDPDNRRAVDFAMRERALNYIRARWTESPTAASAELFSRADHDSAKMFAMWRAVSVRRGLLLAGTPFRLESISLTTEGWHWAVASGPRRCIVDVSLRPGQGIRRKLDAVHTFGINQLTGHPVGSDEAAGWARIVVDGAAQVW